MKVNYGSPKHSRHSRLDAMTHFPFADYSGSVTNILNPSSVDEAGSGFLNMGIPGQRRLAAKVFDEFKAGNAGMRAADVPEALKVSE